MTPIEQFVARNRAVFTDTASLLVLNAPSANTIKILSEATQAQFWHHLYHIYAPFRSLPNHHYGDITAPTCEAADSLVMFFPKEKKLADYLLRQFSVFSRTSEVYILGEKTSGIQSFCKKNSLFKSVEKLDSARHCHLYRAQLATDTVPLTSEQSATRYVHDLEMGQAANEDPPNKTLTLDALPSVFSQKQLDAGTRMLLPHLTRIKAPNTSVLDFGCGCGVISLSIQSLNPSAQIDAIDTNAFAVSSTLHNAKQNNLVLRNVFASDGYSAVTQRYDWIVSNPPFHQHLDVNMQTAYGLITQAKDYLTAQGKLLIVVNSFLAYAPVLSTHFGRVTVLEQNSKYTVYLAEHVKR